MEKQVTFLIKVTCCLIPTSQMTLIYILYITFGCHVAFVVEHNSHIAKIRDVDTIFLRQAQKFKKSPPNQTIKSQNFPPALSFFSVKLRIVPKALLGLPISDVPVITTVYYIILFYFDWLFMNGCEKKPNNKLFLSQIKSLHVLVGMTHYTQKIGLVFFFFANEKTVRYGLYQFLRFQSWYAEWEIQNQMFF